jgi:hypothetical protein
MSAKTGPLAAAVNIKLSIKTPLKNKAHITTIKQGIALISFRCNDNIQLH